MFYKWLVAELINDSGHLIGINVVLGDHSLMPKSNNFKQVSNGKNI